MWHLTNIPKIAHFYWGGDHLSYLRFLTVQSFRIMNPDWKMKIHMPTIIGERSLATCVPIKISEESINYIDKIHNLDIEIIHHDFEDTIGNNAWEVHKSDLLRWKLLSTDGGLWSDFDIIYKLPMSKLIENKVTNSHLTTMLCPYRYRGYIVHAIGFLMSSADNTFFKHIFEKSLSCYNPHSFQGIGNELFKEFLTPEILNEQFTAERFEFADDKSVYSIIWNQVNEFYREMDAGLLNKLRDPQIIGFHWYGGHKLSKEFEEKFNEQSINEFNNIISNTAKILNQIQQKITRYNIRIKR